jgi:peptidoglycan L-alanyl-D-glutamate endopeptidase CwlK
MPFFLGAKSRAELVGVHPTLQRVVLRALELSPQDFSVHDGLRTLEEQEKLVATGASKTLNSKHLKQGDGFGHAVDLVPFLNGKLRWEWPLIYPIAEAIRSAAIELRTPIRWGGTWNCLNDTTENAEKLVSDYVSVRLKAGKKAFVDGPHYELLEG